MNRDVSPPPGRAIFPLYAKILVCFLANIALVAGVAVWLLRSHFGLESDWLLTRDARQRLQLLGQNLNRELARSDRAEWDAVLERLSLAQAMSFGLFDPGGRQVAGETMELPEPVRRRLARNAARRGPGDPIPRPGGPPDGPGPGAPGPAGDRPGPPGRGRPEPRDSPRPPASSGGGAAGVEPGRRPGPGAMALFPAEALSTDSPRG
jgi:hypothetical protein